jgi:hypothetical protein
MPVNLINIIWMAPGPMPIVMNMEGTPPLRGVPYPTL